MDWQEFCDENIPSPKTVTVEAYAASGGYGEAFATAVDVSPCVITHKRRFVKTQTADAAGGNIVSSATVYCPPGTTAPAKSKVTLPGGVVSRVLTSATWDDHGLGLPSHTELLLE